jgi:uncharacterized protein with HEPN domain
MSPTRRDVDYLADAAEAMRRVVVYTDTLSYRDFETDTKTQDAVIRNLQVLGEAVKRLSSETRRAYPDLPWREMAGLRDKLVHDYFGTHLSIIWAVARQELPELLPRIEALVTRANDPDGLGL